jgi:hypothetical protein
MNSISIPFEDSINTQALEHESASRIAMVDAYTKMKPDSFKSQRQAVLTTNYEDIKGVAPSPRSSSASLRTTGKMTPTPTPPTSTPPPTPTPPTPPPPPPRRWGAHPAGRGRHPHPAGRGLLRPPALGARAARRRGGQRVVKRPLARPKADAD